MNRRLKLMLGVGANLALAVALAATFGSARASDDIPNACCRSEVGGGPGAKFCCASWNCFCGSTDTFCHSNAACNGGSGEVE